MQDREDAIEQIGRTEFYSNSAYEHLYDLPVPPCFLYVFNIFIQLYNMSGESGITWTEIKDFCIVRDVKLSQLDINYILKMKNWANEQIAELRETD